MTPYKSRRRIIEVRWVRERWIEGWIVREKKMVLDRWAEKKTAIRLGAGVCNDIVREGGIAELMIFNKDGKLGKGSGSRRTYGKDPRKSHG